jgi:hypothetical protein
MNNDNFFSVDRLIEFGMGMGIAQQMVNSMNNALQDAYLPGSQGSHLPGGQPPALPISFFVVIDGRQAGPFNEAEITRLVAEGRITKSTYIWRVGMIQWEFGENVSEFLRIIALAPPPPPPLPSGPTAAG